MTSLTRPLCISKGTHFLRRNPKGTHTELKGNPVTRLNSQHKWQLNYFNFYQIPTILLFLHLRLNSARSQDLLSYGLLKTSIQLFKNFALTCKRWFEYKQSRLPCVGAVKPQCIPVGWLIPMWLMNINNLFLAFCELLLSFPSAGRWERSWEIVHKPWVGKTLGSSS